MSPPVRSRSHVACRSIRPGSPTTSTTIRAASSRRNSGRASCTRSWWGRNVRSTPARSTAAAMGQRRSPIWSRFDAMPQDTVSSGPAAGHRAGLGFADVTQQQRAHRVGQSAVQRDLSRFSHRLSRQHRTEADSLDIRRILICGYGLCRTGRTQVRALFSGVRRGPVVFPKAAVSRFLTGTKRSCESWPVQTGPAASHRRWRGRRFSG